MTVNKIQKEIDSFIIDTIKKFQYLNLSTSIMSLNHVINNKKLKRKILKNNEILIIEDEIKSLLSLKPKFKVVVKKHNVGIVTLELEKRQKRGYHVILEKSIKINPLNKVYRHIGIDRNSEMTPILEKDYDEFIDSFTPNNRYHE
jgi:hypothetical protein